jgi:hypothetical protein
VDVLLGDGFRYNESHGKAIADWLGTRQPPASALQADTLS